jgi:hypothetical protein
LGTDAYGAPAVCNNLTIEYLFDCPIISDIIFDPENPDGRLYVEFVRSGYDFYNEQIAPIDDYLLFRRPADSGGDQPDCPPDIRSGSWELCAIIDAHNGLSYFAYDPLFEVPAPPDVAETEYVVAARAAEQYFCSRAECGHSLDPDSPAMPTGLTAEPGVMECSISWQAGAESDIIQYCLHKGSSADFIPDAANVCVYTGGTACVDIEWQPGSGTYYKLAACDRHGNLSEWAVLGPVE